MVDARPTQTKPKHGFMCLLALSYLIVMHAESPAPEPVQATPAQQSTPRFAYERTIPATTTGLQAPMNLSIYGSDRLHVLDLEGGRLKVLDAQGNVLADKQDPDPGPYAETTDREIDFLVAQHGLANGRTLVMREFGFSSSADQRYRRHFQIDLDGKLEDTSYRDFDYPQNLTSGRRWYAGIAVNPDLDHLYTLEAGWPSVQVHRLSSGEPLGFEALPLAPRWNRRAPFGWYVDIDVMEDGRWVLLNQAGSELLLRRSAWNPGRPPNREYTIPGRPIKTASLGNEIFVLDVDGSVRILDGDGRFLEHFDARGPMASDSTFISDLDLADDGSLYALDGSTGDIHVFTRQPDPLVPPSDGAEDRCHVERDKSASPPRVVLGESVEIALEVSGACPKRSGMDLLILLERNRAALGAFPVDPLGNAKPLADELIRVADLERDRIGIMANIETVDLDSVHPLSADRQDLLNALGRLEREPNQSRTGPFQRHLSMARTMLDGPGSRPDARKVMLIFSTNGYPGLVLPDRFRVLLQGTRLVAISALSKEEDLRYSMSVRHHNESVIWPMWLASGYWDQVPAGELEDMSAADLYAQLQEDSQPLSADVLASTMVITDVIPANMRLDPGSVQPPADWDAGTRTLTWRLADLPFTRAELRYRLYPEESGVWPTNVVARAEYEDGLGQPGAIRFPVPHVEVLAPTPTSTATQMPITPSATATETASPIPTASPTPIPRPIFLPLLLREHCQPEQRLVDAVLVLDASGSMREPAADGQRSKLDAATDAAGIFLDALYLDRGDRAAIVSFHQEAELKMSLTDDRAALDSALDAIVPATGTCLVCGVEAGALELTGERHHPSHAPVLILLTDGRSNPQPASAAVESARRAKAAGVIIYTIGLGSDLDEAALREMASLPEAYFAAPTDEELARIYRQIAVAIPCPPSIFWAER